jgi:hypothetical protein
VILYHFTSLPAFMGEANFEQLRTNPAEGAVEIEATLRELQPTSTDYPGMPPVLWLTTDPDPGGEKCACTIVRLKLRVPSGPRLYPFRTFARQFASKREPGITAAEIDERLMGLSYASRVASQSWWCYQGTIPDSRFVDAEMIRGQMVWWGALGGYTIGGSKPVSPIAA